MIEPQRPLHTCNSCGYQWYSRGADYSLKCPNCGNKDHSSAWVYSGRGVDDNDGGPIIAIVNFVMWGWFMWAAQQADGGAFTTITQSAILLMFCLVTVNCKEDTKVLYTIFAWILGFYWLLCLLY